MTYRFLTALRPNQCWKLSCVIVFCDAILIWHQIRIISDRDDQKLWCFRDDRKERQVQYFLFSSIYADLSPTISEVLKSVGRHGRSKTHAKNQGQTQKIQCWKFWKPHPSWRQNHGHYLCSQQWRISRIPQSSQTYSWSIFTQSIFSRDCFEAYIGSDQEIHTCRRKGWRRINRCWCFWQRNRSQRNRQHRNFCHRRTFVEELSIWKFVEIISDAKVLSRNSWGC